MRLADPAELNVRLILQRLWFSDADAGFPNI
jgi:hypothetical protein